MIATAVVLEPSIVSGIFWLFIFLWRVAETLHSRTEVEESGDNRDFDRGSTLFLTVSSLISVPAGIAVGLSGVGPAIPGSRWTGFVLGCVVMLGGLALRATAASVLGRYFRRRITMQPGHQVIDSGPYRVIRHPAYSGLSLAIAGTGICMGSVLAFIAVFLPVLAAVIYRVIHEERALEATLGSEYSDYAAGRRRLIPAVW